MPSPAATPAPVALSALVVVDDEADQLADCLDSLAFCDEIVVVLDRCSDGSEAVARRFTERLLTGAWPLEGPRRNDGIAACRGRWILEVDADERVTPALAREIRERVAEDAHAVYRVPIDNYIGRRLVRYGWGASFGVSWKPILFRKGAKVWGDQRVHPKLRFPGPDGFGPPLTERLTHYVDRDLSDLLGRFDRYTSARAEDLLEGAEIGSAWQAYRRIPSRFWKCFVVRKGYREGAYGFLIALLAGLYPFVSWLKARHRREQEGQTAGNG